MAEMDRIWVMGVSEEGELSSFYHGYGTLMIGDVV